MHIYIDSANKTEISELQNLKLISGVTTNPSLMAKEGVAGEKHQHKHYKDICNLIDGPISAEVIALDFDGMIREAYDLAALHPNIVVKIPMTKEGLQVIHTLSSEGIKTNCTLIFSSAQAILAAKAGATYVSPFIGRLDDTGENGLELIKSIRAIFANYQFKTKILAASIRSKEHIIKCAEIGADIITAPYSIITSLIDHPLTDKGLKQFIADHAKLNKSLASMNGSTISLKN